MAVFQLAAVIAVVLLLLVVLSALFGIVRQQGRILLRLDTLSRQIYGGTGAASQNGFADAPIGIDVGGALPDFRVPDLDGRPVTLGDFVGKRVLLLNWSPQCGFCELIAPELAKLAPDLAKQRVELVFLGHGGAQANRKLADEHGLQGRILLLEEEGTAAFESFGTPVAYLLTEQGRVAAPLAVGADQVLELAQAVATRKGLASERSLSESRLEREGLKPGTRAPSFALPKLSGGTLSLDDFRGRRVLLVFSDPECGPCDALAPELSRFYGEHGGNGLDLVLVGRGDLEANRIKAAEHGWEFPVVVQKRWTLSKQYGIFATPIAFLIDEEGVIARPVATGPDDIISLAHEAVAVLG